MDSSPAVLTVVPQTVYVPTEIGSIPATAVHSVTFVTDLVIQHIWLDLNLGRKAE